MKVTVSELKRKIVAMEGKEIDISMGKRTQLTSRGTITKMFHVASLPGVKFVNQK